MTGKSRRAVDVTEDDASGICLGRQSLPRGCRPTLGAIDHMLEQLPEDVIPDADIVEPEPEAA